MSYQDYIDQKNAELLEDLLGRGPGDPDVHGYPGEEEASDENNGDQ